MIKSITVTNHLGESLKMELAFPEKSGFAVHKIDGLGPPKANVNSIELATSDGSIFTSSRITSRNIIIGLKFLSKPTTEDVRQLTYKYFPIKKRIKLLVEADNRSCYTHGYVESNEPDIFSKDSGCQISVLCQDPYLYSEDINVTVFSGIDSMFEFEWSNESLSEDLIEFGEIKNNTFNAVYYNGEVDAGLTIIIHALNAVSNISIFNAKTNESMTINIDLIQGDDLIISTLKGGKYASLLRGGTYTNVLNLLDKSSNWFQLTKGENVFVYTAQVGVENLEFRMENHIVYEGV